MTSASRLLTEYVSLFPQAYIEATEEIQQKRSRLFIELCTLEVQETILARSLLSKSLRYSDPYAIAYLRILCPEAFLSKESTRILSYWNENQFPGTTRLLFLTFWDIENRTFVKLWLKKYRETFRVFLLEDVDFYHSFITMSYQLYDLVSMRDQYMARKSL